MGKQAPAPSDYGGLTREQSRISQSTADAQTQQNRANTQGPIGTQTWTRDAQGRPVLQQGFSAGVQPVADALQSQAASAWGAPLDNGTDARNQTIQAAYGQATSRLDPQWAQRQQLQQSQLANQGLDPTSAAARASNLDFGQQRNDAYSSAMNGAINAGNQAGSQVFQNNLAARNAPLSALMALSGQASQGPQYAMAGRAADPQLLAAAMGQDQAQLGAWQASNQANADAISGAMRGAGSIVGGIVGLAGGGVVPGQARVPGDSPANDTVPAMLSPGEVVLPRSAVQHMAGGGMVQPFGFGGQPQPGTNPGIIGPDGLTDAERADALQSGLLKEDAGNAEQELMKLLGAIPETAQHSTPLGALGEGIGGAADRIFNALQVKSLRERQGKAAEGRTKALAASASGLQRQYQQPPPSEPAPVKPDDSARWRAFNY